MGFRQFRVQVASLPGIFIDLRYIFLLTHSIIDHHPVAPRHAAIDEGVVADDIETLLKILKPAM